MLLPLPANPTSPTRMVLTSSRESVTWRAGHPVRAGSTSGCRRSRGLESTIAHAVGVSEARLQRIEPASRAASSVSRSELEVAEPDAVEGVDDQAGDVGDGLGARAPRRSGSRWPGGRTRAGSRRAAAPGRTRRAAGPAAGTRPRRPRATPSRSPVAADQRSTPPDQPDDSRGPGPTSSEQDDERDDEPADADERLRCRGSEAARRAAASSERLAHHLRSRCRASSISCADRARRAARLCRSAL